MRHSETSRPLWPGWVCAAALFILSGIAAPSSTDAQARNTPRFPAGHQEKGWPPPPNSTGGTARAAEASATRTVTDESGREVTLPTAPQRIISLAPSVTETLYALGLGERVVGVTTFCDYPPAAREKPKIGGAVNPSFEEIAMRRPDLIVATTEINRKTTVDALERLGMAVYVTSPASVEGMIESVKRLAELAGVAETGAALADSLRSRLEKVREHVGGQPKKKVVFVVWPEPLITIGKETFLADAIRWAGGEPAIDAPGDWPRVGMEELVRVQPEYLIFASAHGEQQREEVGRLKERPGWRVLEAMKENRVVILSDAINRPSPRMVDAIEALARQLHPAAFEKKSAAMARGKVRGERTR